MRPDASLFTLEAGPRDAECIVFLHGGGAGSWMWQPVIARLPEYHCLAPDLPEVGGSRQVGPFSIPFAAQKVAELIRARAPEGKAHVVGLSNGAQVAVQLLASAPEVCCSAFISSALLRPVPGMGMMGKEGVLRWTYRLSVPPFRSWDWWIRLNMKYSSGIPDEYFEAFKRDFQAMEEGQFTRLMLENQRFRLPDGLEKAHLPVLVVTGSKEYAAMKQSARDLAAKLPQAKAAQVNLGKGMAAEHNWALTAPELFARAVRAWVRGEPLPEGLEELAAG